MNAKHWVALGILGSIAAVAAPSAAQEKAPQPADTSIRPKDIPPAKGEQRFVAALRPTPGGLRADEVAKRAELVSFDVAAKEKAVEAAAAKVDQATLNFAPRFSFLARYTRRNQLDPVSFTPSLPADVLNAIQDPIVRQIMAGFSNAPPIQFPANIYTLQGTATVPLSDYVFRIQQNVSAQNKGLDAAKKQVDAARYKARRDALVAYYNWARARAAAIVAEQSVETVAAHVKDAEAVMQVGRLSKADVMRAKAQLAETELFAERTKTLVAVTDEAMRVTLQDKSNAVYEMGDDLMEPLPPMDAPNLEGMVREAVENRPELRALDDTAYSVRELSRVLKAGYWPRLDAVGNLTHQKPNMSMFPQTNEFKTSWDVSLQLSWTINDTLTARPQVRETEAKALEIEAQRSMILNGIRMEVTQAVNSVRETRFAIDSTTRRLEAAEESYRVRSERYKNGEATNVELTDAENELIRARLENLNARIDARVAWVNLQYSLGRLKKTQ